VLSLTIVVAGNHAGSDIGTIAYRCVSQIAEVASLRPFAKARFFHLNKVADVGKF
jgi:hypothetical protein